MYNSKADNKAGTIIEMAVCIVLAVTWVVTSREMTTSCCCVLKNAVKRVRGLKVVVACVKDGICSPERDSFGTVSSKSVMPLTHPLYIFTTLSNVIYFTGGTSSSTKKMTIRSRRPGVWRPELWVDVPPSKWNNLDHVALELLLEFNLPSLILPVW